MSKSSQGVVCLLVLITVFSSLSFAVTPDRINGTLTSGSTVALHGNVHHKALPQFDQGPASPSLRFGAMTLLTTPTPAQIKDLKTLLVQQQDPKSPKYHKWLTPEQWADRFGLSQADVTKLTKWLTAQGFTIGAVARGRNWITFSGTAAQVQSAFGTEIHQYKVDGEVHVANASAPKIPALLSGIVTNIRGMDDFRVKPHAVRRSVGPHPNYNSSNFGDLVAPGDIATIYDINALYNASTPIDGTGQKLAIIGQTDIFLSDINDFRTGFGESSISCTTTTTGTVGIISACNDPHFKYVFVNDTTVTDPLTPLSGDLSEADLDLEWSGAVARGAQLIYVNAPYISNGQNSTGGVWDAWYWAVDNDLAPVISMSYGLCEFFDNYVQDNSGNPLSDELELMKANSEGITFVNSSGDFGAAECDSAGTGGTLTTTNLATQGIAVGYPASSPEVTGVGGTAIPLANFSSTYWGTSNGTDGGSVLPVPGYIPEQAWNDDDQIGQFCAQSTGNLFCTQGGQTPVTGWISIVDQLSAQNDIGPSSGGGGASNCAVQNAGDSQNLPNTFCVSGFPQPTWQSVSIPNQQSARFSPDVSLLASPNFPGYIFCTQLSELGIQGTGGGCDAANGGISGAVENDTSIIGGTSASSPVFAGIVTLLNQYMNGASATGLGNINPMLYELARNPANSAFHPIITSNNEVYCQGNTPSTQPANVQCPVTGLLGFLGSNSDATTSYNLVTGLGSVDANNLAIAWNALATQPGFTLTPSSTSLTATAGSNSNPITVTINPLNGFTGTVTFTCAGLPTGTTCSPATGTTSASVYITTTANMPNVQNVPVVITGTSGSVTASTAVNLSTSGGTSSFTLQSNIGSGSISVAPGGTATVNLQVVGSSFVINSGGNSQTSQLVSYTCTGLPSEAQCAFSPNASTQSVFVTVNITTTAPTAKLLRKDSGRGIFYAALFPGLIGIVFTFRSRKQSLRGIRFLGMIAVLGLSTMWLASCGGSSGGGGSHNAGTPAGSYPITVNAATTSGGPSASTTFTLTVN